MKFPTLLAFLVLPALALAQGVLTPPGAPAPTMKTLDQLEARTPIGAVGGSTALITIAAPGSYVLMGNVSVASGSAITITANNNVTLDLNGFTLSSTANPAAGIAIALPNGTPHDITIRNGHILGSVVFTNGTGSGAGFLHGIYASGSLYNCLVTDVSISGLSGAGVLLDMGSTIDRCVAMNCNIGLAAQTIANCYVTQCGGGGISGRSVTNCESTGYGGTGISATTASNCSGYSTTSTGLQAISAINCYGTSASGTGMYAFLNAANCSGTSSSGIGLYAGGNATNCFGSSSSGSYGMQVLGTASFCRGDRSGGTAISAAIAVACTAANGSITATLSKQLGTP